jgi:hypothetical protein
MFEFGLTVGGFKPRNTLNVDPVTGPFEFHSSLGVGAHVAVGMTDRLEVTVSVPKVLCFDDGQPSLCSPWNRYINTGLGVSYAALRRPRNDLTVGAGVWVAANQPLRLRWSLGGNLKTLVVANRFALVTGLHFQRSFDAPPNGNPLLVFVTADLNLQVTRRFLVYGILIPWGSLGDLDGGIALQALGGASFTFNPSLALGSAIGGTNLLDQRPWDHYVHGWYATLQLTYWRY